MAGTMSLADLQADLKAAMLDAAAMFTAALDADYTRHLTKAAEDFSRVKPLTRRSSLTLVADQAEYGSLPADFHGFRAMLWGSEPYKNPQPWDVGYVRLPLVAVTGAGTTLKLMLDPAPTAAQLASLGSEFRYTYYVRRTIGAAAADTTILPGDRNLLLLRGQAEALRELAVRGIAKPVQLRDGLGLGPRNGSPAALYQELLKEFECRAAA